MYSINHAETTIIFASTQNIPIVLQLAPQTPKLKVIVAMEELSPDVKSVLASWSNGQNIKFMEFHEIEQLGRDNPSQPLPESSEAIATICYTSVCVYRLRDSTVD